MRKGKSEKRAKDREGAEIMEGEQRRERGEEKRGRAENRDGAESRQEQKIERRSKGHIYPPNKPRNLQMISDWEM